MSRKAETVTITDEGRDQGKSFLITEMPASQAERWALRVLSALARSGVDVPEDVAQMGMAAIAQIGLRALAGVNFLDAEPLLEEMFACVQILPDPTNPAIVRPIRTDDDIEEVKTRLFLRGRVLALHVDFSKLADRSKPPAPPMGELT